MNKDIDSRADLYAIGSVLFELVCGRPPFIETDHMELVSAQIGTPPPIPCKINHAIPDVISNILLLLLAKNADERYQQLLGSFMIFIWCKKI
jgi:serine/threonine protein kinase